MKKTLTKFGHAHYVFALIAAVFGLCFVFITPLLWGADETSHVGRTYQISQGHVFAHVVHEGYSNYGFGGEIPSNLMRVVNYVNYDFNVNTHQKIPGVKWVDVPSDYKTFANLPLSGHKVGYNFSNTAIYSPLTYAPAVIGFWIAEAFKLHIGATIYLGRIFDLGFYTAVIAYVLYTLRTYKAKWIIFTVALLPSVVYQASTITADNMTNVLALVIVGLVIKALLARDSLNRLETWVLCLAAAGLPLAKPSYLFISLLVLIIPAKKVPVRQRYRKFLLPGTVLLGILVYALWQYKTRYLSNASKDIIAGVVPWWQSIDSTGQVKFVLHHPLSATRIFTRSLLIEDNGYFNGLFGSLGFDYVQTPAMAVIASFTAMALAVAASETFIRTRRTLIYIGAICAVSVLAVLGTLYLAISYVGQPLVMGVQGRYFLPILPVFLLLIVLTTRTRLSFSRVNSYRRFAIGLTGLMVFSLFITVIKFYYITWG